MPKPQPSLLSRVVFGNVRNKGISLVFAILIWVFAFSHTKQEGTVDVDVLIESGNPDRVVLKTESESESGRPFAGQVSLTLEGPRNLLNEALATSFRGKFKVNESGLLLLEDTAGFPDLPPGVVVIKASPKWVNVSLDDWDVMEKNVTTAGLKFTPSDRFRMPDLSDYTFDPPTVRVRGPSTKLDSVRVLIDSAPIEDWDREQWEATLKLTLHEKDYQRGVFFADGAQQSVKVRVTLKSALDRESFMVPIIYSHPADPGQGAFRLTGHDTQVELTCRGTEEALAELRGLVQARKFEIWAEIQDFSGTIDIVESSKFQWPDGSLPPGIERRSMVFDPDPIQYKVERPEDTDGAGQ